MLINGFTEKDFPGLYQASDDASKKAQSQYIVSFRIDLFSMIASSGLAIYNYESEESKSTIYIISGLFLVVGLYLSIIIKTKKYEDIWYQGRALAESCKTLTWRYMMCSEFFEVTLSKQDVEDRFINRVRELSKEFKELNQEMNANKIALPNITTNMNLVRSMSIDSRKRFYINNRIQDQKKWYSSKAEFNKRRSNYWFYVIILSQALGILSIIFLIKYPSSSWNLVGLFTTISSCALSWLQLKQHQELKQAYTTATQELNFILELSNRVTTDQELSIFVLDSENAISREHTLWLAQRRR